MTASPLNKNVVFLTGSMCDARLFAPQIDVLGTQGFNCRVENLTSALSYTEFAQQTLERIQGNFAIVGLSMGGTLALEVFRQAPERITHLALLNTTAKADRAKETRLKHIEQVKAGGLMQLMEESYFPKYLSPTSNAETILPLVREMAADLGPTVFEYQSHAMMGRASMEPVLSSIQCPTLILAGRDDIICPVALHREMANAIPHANFEILADCGHISTLEQPELVTEALLHLFGIGGQNL